MLFLFGEARLHSAAGADAGPGRTLNEVKGTIASMDPFAALRVTR